MPQYKIHYGNSTIDGGLFLRRQMSQTEMPHYQDGQGQRFRHLSTFSGKSTIKEGLIDLLNGAKEYIFFASFLIQDDDIIRSLINSVKRLRGHVYVLTTLKDSDFNSLGLLESQINDDQWNFKDHIKCVQKLVHHGISVKARKDCHAKFAVIDDKYAIVTSANSVPTCFGDVPQKSGRIREANPENGVLIELPLEVKRLGNFFRAIWRSAHNYELPPDSRISEIVELSKGIIPITCCEPASMPDDGQILWTAPGDCRILNSIIKMIDAARKRIIISSWVIKGIEKHVFGDKLIETAKRGVEIELLLRGMYRRDHLDSCYFLKKKLGEQIRISGDFTNHSKAILTDESEAMVLTANIDSQHGLDFSVEIGFLSKVPDFVNSVGNFLDRLRAGCCLEYVANPKQKYAAEKYSSWDKPVITSDLVIDVGQQWKSKSQSVRKMISEMNDQLIRVSLPEENTKHRLRLLTNNMIVDCANYGNNRLKLLHIDETAAASNLRFQQILPEMTIQIDVS